jgi:hypothetical protein
MYAHKNPMGTFTSTLPQGLLAASTETAPIFFDPEVQELVCMGLHPFNDQATDTENVEPSGKLITFYSPLDMLYRVDLDLNSSAKVPFLVEISTKSGKRLAVKECPIGSLNISLKFPHCRKSNLINPKYMKSIHWMRSYYRRSIRHFLGVNLTIKKFCFAHSI